LETKVLKLEAEVRTAKPREKPNWLCALEKFADNQNLLDVFADAMKLREADRKKAHGGKAKARKSWS